MIPSSGQVPRLYKGQKVLKETTDKQRSVVRQHVNRYAIWHNLFIHGKKRNFRHSRFKCLYGSF